MNLSHIESRSSKRVSNDYEFLVEIDSSSASSSDRENIKKALQGLEKETNYMKVISHEKSEDKKTIPWFPSKKQEIDLFANHILEYGSELKADHPVRN